MEVLIGGVRIDHEGFVSLAQKACGLSSLGLEWKKDVRGKIPSGRHEFLHDAAQVGILDSGRRGSPSLHPLLGLRVGGIGMVEGSDECNLVTLLSHPREELRDLDARCLSRDWLVGTPYLGRSIGLHIPGIELGYSSQEKQENAAHIVAWISESPSLQKLEVRQCHSQKGQRAGVQEVPATQSLAKRNGNWSIKSQHEAIPKGGTKSSELVTAVAKVHKAS